MRTGSAWSGTTRCVGLPLPLLLALKPARLLPQEFYLCRKPERVFNSCVFENLVRCSSLLPSAR